MRVAFVRGIGGVGKSTITQAFVEDMLENAPNTVAIRFDAGSLGAEVDVASMIRMLSRGLESSSAQALALVTAANMLDSSVSLLRQATAPSNASPSDQLSWQENKKLALEAMAFFSAAALEMQTFGQATSSATSLTSAVLRAASEAGSNARTALAHVVAKLYADGTATERQRDVLLEPERFAGEAVREFLDSFAKSHNSIVLVFDKAEDLAPQIAWLTETFSLACTEADPKLLVIFSGRIASITVAGRPRSIEGFASWAALPCCDVELGPFNSATVSELLGVVHHMRHGVDLPGDPPEWVVDALMRTTGGLPLWALLASRALSSQPITSWVSPQVRDRLDAISSDSGDAADILFSILRETRLPDGKTALPLVAALAISPTDLPLSHLAKAASAQLEPTLTRRGLRQWGFMRGDGLHDSVRSAMLQFLATAPEGRELAGNIANSLNEVAGHGPDLKMALTKTDELILLSTIRWLGLRVWIDLDDSLNQAIAVVHTAATTPSPHVLSLVRQIVWYSQRMSPSAETMQLLRRVSDLVLPHLLAALLYEETMDHRDGRMRHLVEDLHQDNVYLASIGRRAQQTIDAYGAVGLGETMAPARANLELAIWLVHHGLNNDADRRLAQLAKIARELDPDAWFRNAVGQTMSENLMARARLAPPELERHPAFIAGLQRSIDDLIEVDAVSAAPCIASLANLLDHIDILDNALNLLMEHVEVACKSLKYCQAVGEMMFNTGRFEESIAVYEAATLWNPDWMEGWRGRLSGLLAQGRIREFATLSQTALRVIDSMPTSNLTELGVQKRSQVQALAGVGCMLTGDSPKVLGAPPDNSRIEVRYSWFLHLLFANERERASDVLAELIARDGDARVFAVDIALLSARRGDLASAAHEGRQAFSSNTANVGQRAVEVGIIRAACLAGWLPAELAAEFEHILGPSSLERGSS